jgi:DNA mismatch repair protein MutS2
VGTELDLRGLTVDDAVYTCDRYLDEAVLGNAPWVRIIHGKGTGALRKAIQQQLAGDPRVVQYRLGESGEGGDGVTVAYLEEPNQ